MKFYQIRESLVACGADDIRDAKYQYAAILTPDEWWRENGRFDMQIDMDMDLSQERETGAVVNMDSLTGSFRIPDREDTTGTVHTFSFALDEKGIVLIDDTDYVRRMVSDLQKSKKWRAPGLERFIYDFLEKIIGKDLVLLESYEKRLTRLEENILRDEIDELPSELNDIRGDLLDLKSHYEQLIDLGQELEENENGFFRPENLRYFRMFTERVIRLQDTVSALRDYIVQLRDLVQQQLSVKQNRIMTFMTVVASIFLPLTLITGWYGMNFKYMPELEYRLSYPAVIAVTLLIVIICIIWFKKKKWM